MNRKQRRQRLVVLAEFLENVVAARIDGARFDMRTWGETRGDFYKRLPIPTDIAKTSECGFKGCAVGWAYFCPPLVKAGIREFVSNDDGFGLELLDLDAERGLADFFGIEATEYDDYDGRASRSEFRRCFMPARGPQTGVKAIKAVAATLRAVAAAEPRLTDD